jgi:hypothetical protein
MGYAYYTAYFDMEGDKLTRDKIAKYLKSIFVENDDSLVNNDTYYDLKDELIELFGPIEELTDEDGYAPFIQIDNKSGNFSFVLDSLETEPEEFFRPIFDAFPSIQFKFQGQAYWCNNGHEMSGDGVIKYIEYIDGNMAQRKIWEYEQDEDTEPIWEEIEELKKLC